MLAPLPQLNGNQAHPVPDPDGGITESDKLRMHPRQTRLTLTTILETIATS